MALVCRRRVGVGSLCKIVEMSIIRFNQSLLVDDVYSVAPGWSPEFVCLGGWSGFLGGWSTLLAGFSSFRLLVEWNTSSERTTRYYDIVCKKLLVKRTQRLGSAQCFSVTQMFNLFLNSPNVKETETLPNKLRVCNLRPRSLHAWIPNTHMKKIQSDHIIIIKYVFLNFCSTDQEGSPRSTNVVKNCTNTSSVRCLTYKRRSLLSFTSYKKVFWSKRCMFWVALTQTLTENFENLKMLKHSWINSNKSASWSRLPDRWSLVKTPTQCFLLLQ